jgi:hypothetical protein
MVRKSISLVPSVKIGPGVFSLEARKYIVSKESEFNGFVSLRMSTRRNIGVGFGMVEQAKPFSCTPTFGVSMNRAGVFTPFISLSFGWW